MARSYRQFCALARALDVVGERWTLLIVRELMLGPRRYGELLDALPGIGTNLLAARLEAMCREGVCERVGRGYALAPRGRALEDVVLALARFGMAPLAAPSPGERMRPEWYAVAMIAAHSPIAAALEEAYEFEIEGETFHLIVADGRPGARRGSAASPAFRLRADLPTFLSVATETVPPSRADIDGDRAAVRRWLGAFRLPQPAAA